jgi:hypothetical protein
MKVEGGCYCGAVRYEVSGDPMFNGQCHCRECQYITGGSPNVLVAVPESVVRYTRGAPKVFKRDDLEKPVVREFCAECGTHLISRPPGMAGMAIIKLGTLDNPNAYGNPQMAVFMVDKQPFHQVPAGMAVFERLPG